MAYGEGMKNRQQELGRSVKLCRKPREVPANFLDWLKHAKEDGEEFAPNLIEMRLYDQRHAFYAIRDNYKNAFRRNVGVYRAILAMFHYSLAETILVNQHEEDWLRKKGVQSSITAQNHMMVALLWLPPEGRRLFAEAGRSVGIDQWEYAKYIQSSIASARFAYAAIKQGVKVQIATTEHDMFQKIDFFCEHSIHGFPTLCVQVKSQRSAEGVALTLLDSIPTRDGLSAVEYEKRLSVWRGVQKFNHIYRRNWIGAMALVGVKNVPIEELIDHRIVSDVQNFFDEMDQKIRTGHPRTQNGDSDPDKRACA